LAAILGEKAAVLSWNFQSRQATALEFARWQHPAMGRGARFVVLHVLFVVWYSHNVYCSSSPARCRLGITLCRPMY